MAKALKYHYEFYDDINEVLKRVEIWVEGFVGDSTELKAGSTPLRRTYNKDVGEKYLGGVVQTSINIEAGSTDSFQAVEISSPNYGDVVIKHKIGSTVLFNAIVVPFEGSDIDLPSTYYNVSLGAECGLNKLASITYTHSGTRKKIIQIIKECLAELPYIDTFPIKVIDNTQVYGTEVLVGTDYWDTYIDDLNFKDDSCLTVIKKLIQVYNEIVFSDGAWYIRNIKEVSTQDSDIHTFAWADLAKTTSSYERPVTSIVRRAGGSFGKLFSQQNIKITKGQSKLRNTFPEGDDLTGTGWTYSGVAALYLLFADGRLYNNQGTVYTPSFVAADTTYVESPLVTFYPFQEFFSTKEKERLVIKGLATKGNYIKHLRFQIRASSGGINHYLTTEGTWYTEVSGLPTPIYEKTYTGDQEFNIDIPQPPYVSSAMLSSADRINIGEFGYFNGTDFTLPATNLAYNIYIRVYLPERTWEDPTMTGDEDYDKELEIYIDYLRIEKADISGVVQNGFSRNYGVEETKDRKIDFTVELGVGYPSYPSGLDCLFLASSGESQGLTYGELNSLTSFNIDEFIAESYLNVLANQLKFYQGTVEADLEFTDIVEIDEIKYRIHNLEHDSRRNTSTVKLVELNSLDNVIDITNEITLSDDVIRNIDEQITKTLGSNLPLRYVDINFKETVLPTGERVIGLRDDFRKTSIYTEDAFLKASSNGLTKVVTADTSDDFTWTVPAEEANRTFASREYLTETGWLLDGNALSASKSIGSTTNFDVSVIRNSVTKANFGATTTDFDATTYNLRNGGTDYVSIESGSAKFGSGIAGNPYSIQILTQGTSPIINRLAFGTDGTGYSFAFSKNQGGTVSDLALLNDSGSITLDVNGGVNADNFYYLNGGAILGRSGNYTTFIDGNARSGIFLGNSTDPSNYYDNGTHYFRNRDASVYYATLNSTGLGIGDTNPSTPLFVRKGAVGSNVAMILNEGYYGFRFMPQAGGSGSNNLLYVAGGESLAFGTDNTERVRIDSSGNLGIGITSPNSKLQVATTNGQFSHFGTHAIGITSGVYTGVSLGYAEPDGSYRKSAIVQEQVGDGAARGTIHILNNGTNSSASATLADARLSILYNGNVGIGTTSPTSKVEISGTTGSYSSGIGFTPSGTGARNFRTFINTDGSFNFDDSTAVATRFIVLASGSIGIGTTSPSELLHINGTSRTTNLKITSGAALGYVALSDANGQVVWTNPSALNPWAGNWNANTNTPTLADGTGTYGVWYHVETAGTVNLGSGSITYAVGDRVIYNGSIWVKQTQNYSLNVATTSVLGGIKQGTGLSIDGSGVASVVSLTTARTISATSDISWSVSFDGSANVTAAATLPNVNSNVGTFRSVTVNAKGLVTAATNPSIVLTTDVSGILPIANGGTGSSTQNFVDLSTTQSSIGGAKTFTSLFTVNNRVYQTGLGGSTYFGHLAGQSDDLTSRNNVGVGYMALGNITSGSNNVAIGYEAGAYRNPTPSAGTLTTNTNSIFIGSGSKASGNNQANQIVIGYNAIGAGANTVTLGYTSTTANFLFGTVKYGTLLKPNNVAGTAGQFLGTDGTQDAWTTLTTSHISGLSAYVKGSLSATSPLVYDDETGNFSILRSGTTSNGYLHQDDWNFFNEKQGRISNYTGYNDEINDLVLITNNSSFEWVALSTSHISNLSSYTGFDARYFTETESDARFVALGGSYANPTWITELAWSKLSGVPSTFTPSAHTLDSHSNVTITSNSSGEILKWNGTTWVNNTLVEAGIQPTLPSGTAGQFLIRNASAELEFFNLELEPTRLTSNKIAVGDSANYLSDYNNFEFLESRFVSILKVDDSTKSVAWGMYGASSNSFISASGGSLTVRGDNGLIFSNFAGGGTLALTVDNDGKVGVTPLGTGGGSTPTLSSTYIGYGSSGNALTGTSNFVYDAIKTAVYFNDSANYLYVGKSVSVSDMFEITAVGARGIQLNTDMDIVIKNNNHLYLGSGASNKRVHIGRGASYNDANHYLVINGETFSFSMDNISGWGDTNSESTPQVGDKVLFNVVDVGGNKRFVPQKINKKLFSTLTSGDTVLTL